MINTRTPPLVTAGEGGEGGTGLPATKQKAFQGENLGLRTNLDGVTLSSEVKMIRGALASPEVIVPPEVAAGLVPLLWDVAEAETASTKDKIGAARAIVLALEYNRRLRRDAQDDQQHLERLGARAAESGLADPGVREAMAKARQKRLGVADA